MGVEDGVGDGCGFGGGVYVVDADEVGSGEDGGYVGGGGGVNPGLRGETWGTQSSGAEEAFAGGAGEDGAVEDVEGAEVGVQGVVLVADFAEAEAGVEDDAVVADAGGGGGGDALVEAGEDVGEEVFLE